MQKNGPKELLQAIQGINLKWITDLNGRAETVALLEEDMEDN